MKVTAPASSANLGAGFDCLALAVDLPFELADEPSDGFHPLDEHHPAAVAHRAAGGVSGALWWRSPIPPGRGLGFSGAARVAGAALAAVAAGVPAGDVARRAFEVAADLEGHPENAAASAFGGFVVCAGLVVASPPVRLEGLDLVVWYPPSSSSTDRSRRALPASVPFADAVHNLSRSASMVAGLVAGDRAAVAAGAVDRLHQVTRLADQPRSASVLETLVAEPATWAAWLSGSGPTVAALVESTGAERVASALAPDGRAAVRAVASSGVVVDDA